jgi:hypothetical protein
MCSGLIISLCGLTLILLHVAPSIASKNARKEVESQTRELVLEHPLPLRLIYIDGLKQGPEFGLIGVRFCL